MFLSQVSFIKNVEHSGRTVVVGVYSDGSLSRSFQSENPDIAQVIAKNIKTMDFSGELYETRYFLSFNDRYKYIVLIGLGEPDKKFTPLELEKLGAAIYSHAAVLDDDINVMIDADDLHVPCNSATAFVGFGALLKSWSFDKYKPSKNEKIKLKHLRLLSKDVQFSEEYFKQLRNIADGIFLTRTLVAEPSNVIYPASLAQIATDELKPLGVKIEVLEKEEMSKLGMNALLGVGQGSVNEPRLVVLSWNGGKQNDKPVVFVGKGVTFDSGGISIKPDNGMNEMCHDMAGSGTVLGLLKAVALNKVPVNVVGVMALVENMPSGAAQRPGDIVKSMSGQTIEILSTDAEGRLILADALWYAQDRFAPCAMIDLATLTGAIVVALGHEFAGLFSNNDELADQIVKSSIETGEKVWRMPLTKHFDDGINSDVADMQNLAKPNVRGGSITAAQFLQRFVNKTNWAHIDIAGVEATTDDDVFICSKGTTGFGVHLLYDFLQKNYVK